MSSQFIFLIMSILQAIILGIVQGLTEFLPVSSSGHLVLANYYFGWSFPVPIEVDIITNTGTLLAVLISLRHDIYRAAVGFFRGLVSKQARKEDDWHLAILVILGSIPTAIIGLLLKPYFESLNTPFYVSIALILTGLILWFAPKTANKSKIKDISFKDALLGGIAQGLAVIPGISRSGSTITAMLWRDINPELAARFSFLMYLVVSLGVTIMSASDLKEAELGLGVLFAMFLASFITGFLALKLLFYILKKGQFKIFAPYLWLVATITLIKLLLF